MDYAVVDPETGKMKGIVKKIVNLSQLRSLSHPLRWQILNLFFEKPTYPKEIAKRLNLAEQLVYYHVRKLKETGIIVETAEVRIRGGKAILYAPAADGFVVLFRERESDIKYGVPMLPLFMLSLIRSNDPIILVLSSPEPHGPYRSRGRDHHIASEIVLRIGALIDDISRFKIKLDTHITREELQNTHLIIFGGPLVNVLSAKVNNLLPIYFDVQSNGNIVSTLSGKTYTEDECGVVEVIESPFNPERRLVLIAGKSLSGTRAVVKALIKHPNAISRGNTYRGDVIAHVVEGVDEDGDGIIDNAVILE